ncbi:hypothetical protein [Geobacillus sp. B4113_201601]|uniref:hypothetical protein n=1 Tax=Geobacillus sp. B4113_201601 TaxID=1586290 RepID=UPI000B046AC8|nr:hypothetical protein [Geobacillus sp. B4113_201601]
MRVATAAGGHTMKAGISGKGGAGTMKKKLEQAVEYANKTNPSSKSNNQPSTSKKGKTKF